MISMFYDATAGYLRKMGYQDVVEVTDIEEGMQYSGACETCYYEYIALTVTYIDSNGKSQKAEIDSTFVEFINALD